jgi:hypothetical protein
MQLAFKAIFVVFVSGLLLLDGLSLLWRGLGFGGLKPEPRSHPIDQILFSVFGEAAWPFVAGVMELVGAIAVLWIFFWRAFAKTEKRI